VRFVRFIENIPDSHYKINVNQITEDKVMNLAAFCARKLYPWKCKLQMDIFYFEQFFVRKGN